MADEPKRIIIKKVKKKGWKFFITQTVVSRFKPTMSMIKRTVFGINGMKMVSLS